ncbi:MAG TPA: hypothetical protein ENJ57_08390 [Rhizobiales bacterium]|nr:hypothetical protein [Hyphomicrobiales bacterium]
MDTTTLSGISSAVAQPAPVSAPKPVAPVRAPERSSSAAEHKPPPDRKTQIKTKDAHEQRLATEQKENPKEPEEKTAFQDEKALIDMVSDSLDMGTKLKVDRDDDTGRIIFQTVMKKTGEVIRQVPSEEMIHLAKSLNMGKGLLVDKEA